MHFGRPSEMELRIYVGKLFGQLERSQLTDDVAAALANCSFAELEQIYMKAKRKTIIRGRELTIDDILEAKNEYMADQRSSI
ncbi:hypothetical protein D3C80_1900710 [compost metagenome]